MKIIVKGDHSVLLKPEGREFTWLQKIADKFAHEWDEEEQSFDFSRLFYALYRLDELKGALKGASGLLDRAFEELETTSPKLEEPQPQGSPYEPDGSSRKNEK